MLDSMINVHDMTQGSLYLCQVHVHVYMYMVHVGLLLVCSAIHNPSRLVILIGKEDTCTSFTMYLIFIFQNKHFRHDVLFETDNGT